MLPSRKIIPDWDPRAPEVTRDQRTYYDYMRQNCPVAYSELMQWSIFRHEDVMRVLLDPETFSNNVSRHLSVPNGMDGPQHRTYRDIIDPYFTPEKMEAFEKSCHGIVDELVTEVLAKGKVELIADFAQHFAARVQCAYLGWPESLHMQLVEWTRKNHRATFAQDRAAMGRIAGELQEIIDQVIETRVQSGAQPEDDITASLMHEEVYGRRLNNQEIASILRNWTVGEIGTITASIGILVQYLAEHQDLQEQLRREPDLLPVAIDEILRMHGPLVASRRVTTRPVEIGGRQIDAGERITLMWISANRDEAVFGDPDEFRLDRDPDKNLLYGAGVHVCPGAPLARLEMRIVMEQLLRRTTSITLDAGHPPTNAIYPASGYATLHVELA